MLGVACAEELFAAALGHAVGAGPSAGDENRWYSARETLAVAKAASALCGDPDLGRRVGEEMYFLSAAEGTTDFLRATGSVGAACDAIAGHGSRMSSDRPIWVHARADSWVEPRTRVPSAEIGDRFFCGTTAGYFARLPSLFGHVGAVIEQECRTSPRADRSLEEDAVWSPRGESNS